MAKPLPRKGMSKNMLFDQFFDEASLRYGMDDSPAGTLAEWVQSSNLILEGRPFSFVDREYLKEVYEDTHPMKVYNKAAQMGLTVEAIISAIHAARYRKFRGVLYLFPSRTDVTEFSKGRITPLIEENPDTLGRWIKDTDSANLKKIWNCFLYLRGMRSKIALKSLPVDRIIFDEMDEAPEEMVKMAIQRLGSSEDAEMLMLSNPTFPDFGIDAAFKKTDQKNWLIKCEHCGHWTNLVDTFPACLLEVRGRVIRACEKCQGELDPSNGEWVAKHPSITEMRGRQFSQLFAKRGRIVQPAYILNEFRTTSHLKQFYNLCIGLAYAESQERLSIEEVLALCGEHANATSDVGPCSMGVDQGSNLHVVIGKRDWTKQAKIAHVGEYLEWRDLDALMQRFNVGRCVVDGGPEIHAPKAFADRYPGKVYRHFYSTSASGGYRWNDGNMTVLTHRTDSLDASHIEITYGRVVLPHRSKVMETFAAHCHNTGKVLEEDEETGSKRYKYIKLASGPDHYRHAFNLECVARKFGADSLFAHSDLG